MPPTRGKDILVGHGEMLTFAQLQDRTLPRKRSLHSVTGHDLYILQNITLTT